MIYKEQLKKLISKSDRLLQNFLMEKSNLPSPRANLSLASDFADLFNNQEFKQKVKDLFLWMNISAKLAPTNDPKEFLPLCAAQALGAFYCNATSSEQKRIMEQLKKGASDDRWRMREAVAMGFQRILEKKPETIQELFLNWLPKASNKDIRAMLVALAHPPALKNNEKITKFAIRLSEKILKKVEKFDETQYLTDDFKVLLKGLEFVLSVYVQHLPEDGFKLLTKFAGNKNKYITKILKSNLEKSRLKKNFPKQTNEVLKKLN